MQGAGFEALALAATYELVEVAPDDLPRTVERLRCSGYSGWNVTVPHKEHVLELLDEIDPDAEAAGSVNTVVNRDGRLHGWSTDGYGLATAIHESFGTPVAGRKFVFLGTGGAARATSVYFGRHGARELVLINRTFSKAQRVADTIRAVAPRCRLTCLPLADESAIGPALQDADVVIQATSLGLHEGDPMPLAPGLLPHGAAVLDMVYRTTPFLLAAEQAGRPTADGRGMLLHQGVRSLEIWTGRAAPVEAMRGALEAALAARRR